jgi:hypothetical protein
LEFGCFTPMHVCFLMIPDVKIFGTCWGKILTGFGPVLKDFNGCLGLNLEVAPPWDPRWSWK